MNNNALFKHCPLGCNSSLSETGIHLPEGNLRRCSACGQLFSACTEKRFEKSMQEFDQPEGTLPSDRDTQRLAKRLGRILCDAAVRLNSSPAQLKLLDVGCSSGSLLVIARDLGFSVTGVEPAKKAAATAQSMGFDVFPGLLDAAGYPDDHFDIVTLFEVIEHLTEPCAMVEEVRRILKPGGLLVIGTGNAASWTVRMLGNKWEYFDIDLHGGHVSFFNPASIRLLAKRCGMQVAAIKTSRVNLAERKDVSPSMYVLAKFGREMLAWPARWFGKGHDMTAILRKPGQA